MKYNRNQFETAILNLADYLNLKNNYVELLKQIDKPAAIKQLVYDLFLVKFDSQSCNDKLYESYKIIYEYATELKLNGNVEFKTN
jgi:hypothetical protein